ncbi:MAG: aldo/keto reductase [Clostridiales bacterium]|jgi:predicted aldo/keto reductase-like oxidoreductase|nr:aldo/keto reductase [Clostridiales bacterium]
MNYRTNIKNGDKIFPLAFGCMRFPQGENELKNEISLAVEKGINYFDTAYIYPNSEERLGRALSALNLRDSVKIATKLPPYFVNKYEDAEKIFTKQLSRLKTDYIDYYLMHMLTEAKTWERLEGIGIAKWAREKKAEGKIKNFGFSYHGGKQEFVKIIEAYDWDFCMIQYNYLDENNQAGKSGLKYAAQRGIPVMVMEPLRGGMLAGNMPASALKVFDGAYVKRSPAEWGFKWVYNHPEVLTVLSGMNSAQMIEENAKTAEETAPLSLTERDFEIYSKVIEAINEKLHVNCTGCGYCMPCPSGVDIPHCFSSLNNTEISGKFKARLNYILHGDKHNASLCTECGKCEKRCPQKIEIRKELKKTAECLEWFLYKPMRFAIRKFMKFS